MHRDRSGSVHKVSGQPDTDEEFYTVAEYARLTRRCDETIRIGIREGRIPARRAGRKYLIPIGTVERELVPTQRGAATACPDDDA